MDDHKQGCPALGGYGHGKQACECGSSMADDLPPLPERAGWAPVLGGHDIYTADQMRTYAQEAARQERERTDAQIVALGVLAMRGVAPEKPPEKVLEAIRDWFDRNIQGCSTKDATELYRIAHGRSPSPATQGQRE
jgi:hypothetical protein